MYYDYFGLKQPPFKITPDTSMFFPGGNRGAILDALIYTILNGEGIIKVVGEVGSGKTMLCRMLEKELPANVEVIYIANPSLAPENILHAIAFDLDLAVQASTSRLEVMNRLQQYLLARHSSGQHVVIFIEEAQSMPIATLEEIRLLSNLETQQNKLLQIVLFGQPELDTVISQREIRQFKERITYSFQLNPFNTGDIRDYLNTRLRASGYRSGEIFQDKAVKLIEQYSAGLVRRVNILADKAMLAAYATNTNQVTGRHVRQAARDSEFVSSWVFRYRQQAILIVLLILLGVGASWLLLSSPDAGKQTATDAGAHNPAQITTINPAPSATASAYQQTEATSQQEQVNTNTQGSAGVVDAGHEEAKITVTTDSYETLPEAESRSTAMSSATGNEVVSSDEKAVKLAADPEVTATELPLVDGNLNANSDRSLHAIEQQLLGLEGAFTPTEMGDNQYTDEELQLLREQLERYPPEVAYEIKPSAGSDTCNLCWSIIYRPLIKADKL